VISGRAPHSHFEGKKVIEAFYKLSSIINCDPQLHNYMKVIFIPNFNVSTCEILVTSADLSQHISTPGTEPSGTSNMKYIMNGGLILGSRDGANLEIEREIG
jgi:starch phosphorylase